MGQTGDMGFAGDVATLARRATKRYHNEGGLRVLPFCFTHSKFEGRTLPAYACLQGVKARCGW
jgi:hypothetical protein